MSVWFVVNRGGVGVLLGSRRQLFIIPQHCYFSAGFSLVISFVPRRVIDAQGMGGLGVAFYETWRFEILPINLLAHMRVYIDRMMAIYLYVLNLCMLDVGAAILCMFCLDEG